MSDAQRPASQTPYAFGTMTFIFGLAIGAVLGGVFFLVNDGDDDPAPVPITGQPTAEQMAAVEDELVAREVEVNGLLEENRRLSQELKAALTGARAEPTELDALRDEAAAKQAEIDSLSAELGAAYEELGRLQGQGDRFAQLVNWVFVLEQMHEFAEGGFADGETYLAPALDDALAQIDDPALTDAVVVGILESAPSDTAPFYAVLQEVLNRMQETLTAP